MFLKMNMKYIPPGFCLIQDTSQNDFDYNVQILPLSSQPSFRNLYPQNFLCKILYRKYTFNTTKV